MQCRNTSKLASRQALAAFGSGTRLQWRQSDFPIWFSATSALHLFHPIRLEDQYRYSRYSTDKQPDGASSFVANPNKKKKTVGDTLKEKDGVVVTTRETIINHTITHEVGIVVGSSVKSRHAGHDLFARVKGFFGGEITSYAEMLTDAAAEATRNLIVEAASRGANAIVKVRYETSTSTDPTIWSSSFCYALAYGTAVKIAPNHTVSADPSKEDTQEKAL